MASELSNCSPLTVETSELSKRFADYRRLTFRGTLVHARCEKCESAEHAINSTPIFLNSSARSLNAIISVGHTKVLCGETEKARVVSYANDQQFYGMPETA